MVHEKSKFQLKKDGGYCVFIKGTSSMTILAIYSIGCYCDGVFEIITPNYYKCLKICQNLPK